ncbi:hypothetical protein ACWD5V_36495 [Streptomyces sp. NPDC002523]
MSDVDDLVEAFKALRREEGATPVKLADYRAGHLTELLGTPGNEEAALQVLGDLIGRMGEPTFNMASAGVSARLRKPLVQRAVRVALGIGDDDQGVPLVDHGNLTQRRSWACGESGSSVTPPYFTGGTTKTHERHEEAGFRVLASLILARAENPSFQEAAARQLAEANQTAACTPAEAIDLKAALPALPEDDQGDDAVTVEAADQTDAGRRGKVRAVMRWSRRAAAPRNPRYRPLRPYEVVLTVMCVGALIAVGALIYTGVIPRPGNRAGTTNPTAEAPSGAPVGEINNTTGWGPRRETYTMKSPAAAPVFNSITDHPTIGDERNFFGCRDLAQEGTYYSNEVIEHPGHTYECSLYFDNDVAPNLAQMASPDTGENLLAMLHDAKARIGLPDATPKPNVGIEAHLSASNVVPPAPSDVWSSCNFVGPDQITLTYVAGSARMVTADTPKDGAPLKGDASFTTTGALLGKNQDGYLGQNGGYIVFNVRVQGEN